jgi:hypothetical protein
MGSLCERPGCSEPALVAYGMRAEDLVFWLDTLRADNNLSYGVLCRRHADSMVVPRHWTLDDLREPEPRLFRSPVTPTTATATTTTTATTTATTAPAPSGMRRRTRQPANLRGEQMTLHPDVVPDAATAEPPILAVVGPDEPLVSWTPTFDARDDLDGLLSARSPLLARAFRGDDRPRPG